MAVCFLPVRWTRMTRRNSRTDVCVSSQPGLLLQVPLRTRTQLPYEATPFQWHVTACGTRRGWTAAVDLVAMDDLKE